MDEYFFYDEAHGPEWSDSMVVMMAEVWSCDYFYDGDAQVLFDLGR